MAKFTKCDICGRTLRDFTPNEIRANIFTRETVKTTVSGLLEDPFHLCERCANNLTNYLDKAMKEENPDNKTIVS